VAFGQNGEATTAMGPVFADCHNEGWLDLFVSDASYHRYYQTAARRSRLSSWTAPPNRASAASAASLLAGATASSTMTTMAGRISSFAMAAWPG